MQNITVIQLSPEELAALINGAVKQAFAEHSDSALSRTELAEHFGVTLRTVDNWIRSYGLQPVTPPGKHKKYSLKEVKQKQQV